MIGMLNIGAISPMLEMFSCLGVFDVSQTKQMLEAGVEAGWNINFHAEELCCLNSVEVSVSLIFIQFRNDILNHLWAVLLLLNCWIDFDF